ncbi:MAG TPA: DUF169 domain-containing protein [Syntrophales bacterium]|nr:DUF169 domain-containing protein [Syntrophales bacterium]
MESKIAAALHSPLDPVALVWSDRKPDDTAQFQAGRWGCIMWLLAGAAKGKTAAVDRNTFGCFGGGVGMGFGNLYEAFPGGGETFCRFLSVGIGGWEKEDLVSSLAKPAMRPEAFDQLLHGERYLKSPRQVRRFLDNLPMTDITAPFVVFRPLPQVEPDSPPPEVVVFFADPDRLSALVVLANYGRDSNESVIIPFAAGCQAVGIYPYREAKSEHPRAVVGLTDISARLHVKRILGDGLMTFAVPWRMFLEMEANVSGSFLERHVWQELIGGNPPRS